MSWSVSARTTYRARTLSPVQSTSLFVAQQLAEQADRRADASDDGQFHYYALTSA
jgi:hypothetical protein